ncbi:MAG TPA: hypothetical protein HPQ00_11465, partial [Magnetococcales bacterium]|nr:hypothetical protein [Magnetococcales bacterium]
MFCAHCGKEELNQDKFCAQCGQEFHPSGSAEAFFGYSGFWRRFAASTIDTLILSLALFIVILIVVFVMVSLLKTPVDSAGNYEGIINIFSLFMYWLYYAIMESSPRQATFGKKLLKIKITDIHGNRISFGRASGRFFGKIPSGLLLLIGYLMAAFTSKKQALHDMMAGCLVVREDDEGMPG